MKCRFQINDVVVCVSVPKYWEKEFRVGGVYTVADIDAGPSVDFQSGLPHNEIGIKVREVLVGERQWFYHWHFRPARKTDLSQLLGLLNPDPGAELKRANTRKTLEKVL